ncbi:hypothetical protein D3C72_1601000 [compost metagenome]
MPNRLAVCGPAKRGEASNCCIITGAPLNWVQPSSRIRFKACSTSHLYISTRRRPARRARRNCAYKLLRWNNGTAIKVVGAKPLLTTTLIRSGELRAQNAP